MSTSHTQLCHAVEANPEDVGRRAVKMFKTEQDFAAEMLRAGLCKGEEVFQRAIASYRSTKYN